MALPGCPRRLWLKVCGYIFQFSFASPYGKISAGHYWHCPPLKAAITAARPTDAPTAVWQNNGVPKRELGNEGNDQLLAGRSAALSSFFPKIQPVAKVKKVPINKSQVHPNGNILFSERINRTSIPSADRAMATTLTRLH
ncbi:MAG: hypothetical protein ABSA09_12850, partial [Desulfobaccales bacterium]